MNHLIGTALIQALNTFDDLIKLEHKMSRAYASKGNIFAFWISWYDIKIN